MKKIFIGMMILGTMAMANNSDADFKWEKETGVTTKEMQMGVKKVGSDYEMLERGNDSEGDVFIKKTPKKEKKKNFDEGIVDYEYNEWVNVNNLITYSVVKDDSMGEKIDAIKKDLITNEYKHFASIERVGKAVSMYKSDTYDAYKVVAVVDRGDSNIVIVSRGKTINDAIANIIGNLDEFEEDFKEDFLDDMKEALADEFEVATK